MTRVLYHLNGIQEVGGSIPPGSTKYLIVSYDVSVSDIARA